eukprot:scaffold13587_cov336-Alexandrium_tamarense.AAC.1
MHSISASSEAEAIATARLLSSTAAMNETATSTVRQRQEMSIVASASAHARTWADLAEDTMAHNEVMEGLGNARMREKKRIRLDADVAERLLDEAFPTVLHCEGNGTAITDAIAVAATATQKLTQLSPSEYTHLQQSLTAHSSTTTTRLTFKLQEQLSEYHTLLDQMIDMKRRMTKLRDENIRLEGEVERVESCVERRVREECSQRDERIESLEREVFELKLQRGDHFNLGCSDESFPRRVTLREAPPALAQTQLLRGVSSQGGGDYAAGTMQQQGQQASVLPASRCQQHQAATTTTSSTNEANVQQVEVGGQATLGVVLDQSPFGFYDQRPTLASMMMMQSTPQSVQMQTAPASLVGSHSLPSSSHVSSSHQLDHNARSLKPNQQSLQRSPLSSKVDMSYFRFPPLPLSVQGQMHNQQGVLHSDGQPVSIYSSQQHQGREECRYQSQPRSQSLFRRRDVFQANMSSIQVGVFNSLGGSGKRNNV